MGRHERTAEYPAPAGLAFSEPPAHPLDTPSAQAAFQRAPVEHVARWCLPGAVALWLASEAFHLTHIPAQDIALTAAALAGLMYASMTNRTHKITRKDEREKRLTHARQIVTSVALSLGWLAVATWRGPLNGPAHAVTLAWLLLAIGGWLWLRRHPVAREAQEWREQRSTFLDEARSLGLSGAHMIRNDKTRVGREYELDTTGTGKLATQIASRTLEERVAQWRGFPISRVRAKVGAIGGRVIVSEREIDPWARPPLHPLLDLDPEIHLPVPCSIRHPVAVGMDPETGRPLTIPLCDERGGKNISVVGQKGAGKTVLLANISERVTAADDALLIRVNLSVKGHAEAQMWGVACHLTAFGQQQAKRAVKILRTVTKIIEWRSRQPRTTADFIPSPANPLIVVMVDEIDSSTSYQGVRQLLEVIATKGREFGVTLVTAGQRGTSEFQGGGTIRSQQDVFCLGIVNRRGEAMHAAGDLGMTLPDMSTYGEGNSGVWVIAEPGGEQQPGRTFCLKEPPDIRRIAAERAHWQPNLPRALAEYLGDAYQDLLASDLFAAWVATEEGQSYRSDTPRASGSHSETTSDTELMRLADVVTDHPTGPGDQAAEPLGEVLDINERLNQLAQEAEDALPDDLADRLHRIDARNEDTRRMLTEPDPPAPAVDPQKLAESRASRWNQAIDSVPMPDDARKTLLTLLAGEGGTTIGAVIKATGTTRWTAGLWLRRLAREGLAQHNGAKGRGARWHTATATDSERNDDAGHGEASNS